MKDQPTQRVNASNDYARLVSVDIDAPKTVWMALAVALADRLDGTGVLDQGRAPVQTLLAEWQHLHNAGIVPQRPRRRKGKPDEDHA